MLRSFPFTFMFRTFYLIISSTAANQNIRTLLDAAGFSGSAMNIVVTINAGVDIYSTSVATPALVTGTIPVGSFLTLINNGDIRGKGGDGGDGSTHAGIESGGDALSLSYDIQINNANGLIFGGGGGGAGGSGGKGTDFGGGGGGAGRDIGTGGAGTGSGNAGADGTFTSGGAGGTGATTNGGDGGDPGAATTIATGGNAVSLNGNSINWLDGNTAAKVRGDVA